MGCVAACQLHSTPPKKCKNNTFVYLRSRPLSWQHERQQSGNMLLLFSAIIRRRLKPPVWHLVAPTCRAKAAAATAEASPSDGGSQTVTTPFMLTHAQIVAIRR
jgi:hypothetical protein